MRIKKIISLNTLNELLKIEFGDGSPEHPIKANTFYYYRYKDGCLTTTMTVYFVKWKVFKSTIYLDIVVVSDKVSNVRDVISQIELKDQIFSLIKKTITGWGRLQGEISISLKNNYVLDET